MKLNRFLVDLKRKFPRWKIRKVSIHSRYLNGCRNVFAMEVFEKRDGIILGSSTVYIDPKMGVFCVESQEIIPDLLTSIPRFNKWVGGDFISTCGFNLTIPSTFKKFCAMGREVTRLLICMDDLFGRNAFVEKEKFWEITSCH